MPNCDALRAKADAPLLERAAQLQALVDDLAASGGTPTPAALASRAEALGVGDDAPSSSRRRRGKVVRRQQDAAP